MKQILMKIVFFSQVLFISLSGQQSKGVNEFFKVNNIELKPLTDTTYVDPFSFFPSQVGNFWQYTGNYLRENRITRDSLLSDGSRYVYEEYWERPTYQIDTSYNVVYNPFYQFPKTLYVLDAKQNERWWVDSFYEDSVFIDGYIAEVDTIYEGYFLGKHSIFKVIKNYLVYNNDGVFEEYWDHDLVLASGIGLVYRDVEVERPMILISAIIDGDTLGTIVSVEDEPKTNIPFDFKLSQNYPNPFNSSTTVRYKINNPGYYKMITTNILGEIIETTEYNYLSSGNYQKILDLKDFSSGVYFHTLLSNKNRQTIKMIYLK